MSSPIIPAVAVPLWGLSFPARGYGACSSVQGHNIPAYLLPPGNFHCFTPFHLHVSSEQCGEHTGFSASR